MLIIFSVDRWVKKRKELEDAELVAEDELLELQRQVNERLARLVRLRKQKRLLQEKGLQMLEKESAPEDLLSVAQEEADAAVDIQAVGGFGAIDWSSVDFDFSEMPSGSSAVAGGTS